MNNKKPWHKKIYKWISAIAGMCTILAFIITLRSITNNDNKESTNTMEDNNNAQNNLQIIGDGNKTFNGIFYGDIIIDENEAPESNTSSESNTTEIEVEDEFNFGQAMQHIYSNEDILQNEIIDDKGNKPINSSIYPGVNYWYISDQVRLIVVTNGFRDNECSRTYYFDENEKLTFALIKDDIGEHRLYFYNDILIRYIDENGQNYDVDINLDDCECEWTNLALKESYEIFSGTKKPLDTDEFSVTASYDMNTPQTAIDGSNVLIKAKTSFPADCVTIEGISDNAKLNPTNMHGGLYEWQFIATFYIKGTYIVTITAYNSEGESVSDEFTFIY